MIEPVLDNLLLEPMEAESVSKSGIIRPETAKEKPEIGRILAVGPKVESQFVEHNKKGSMISSFESGWKAVYKKWMANEVKYEGKTYILVAEKDVLGVIK